jgi:arginine decarboxylase-like protein
MQLYDIYVGQQRIMAQSAPALLTKHSTRHLKILEGGDKADLMALLSFKLAQSSRIITP